MALEIISQERLDFIKKENNPSPVDGFNNGILLEANNQFIFNKADGETYIPDDANKRNTYIVFGRDRPSTWESGYGGAGHGKASAIDIVVGRLSAEDASKHQDQYVNSNIGADASRIYLSQKANIDEYYSLADGNTGKSKARAAIAIKSDDIRIVARNTIKIVTEKDSKLSTGDPNYISTGVQLIANNDSTDMQPIPKGKNLVNCLETLSKNIIELNGIVFAFMEIQNRINTSLSFHTHISPFFGKPTSPSIPLLNEVKAASLQMNLKVHQGLKNNINNLAGTIFKYTTGGPEYINSKFHFLN